MADTPLGLLVIVCDGMGGGPAGKTASTIAARAIAEAVMASAPESDPSDAMRRSVEAANVAVVDATRQNPALRGMGTTCVAVLVGNGMATVAHVGDSRCYQIRGGKMVFRTADHSYVAELVRKGELTEEEARNSNFSNVITRAIGGADTVEVEIDRVETEPGDRFALMTDGIWGAVKEEDLVDALGQERPIIELVGGIAEAIDNYGRDNGGGHDNLTLAIVSLSEAGSGLHAAEDDSWSISNEDDPEGEYQLGEDEAPANTSKRKPVAVAPAAKPVAGRTLAEKVAADRAAGVVGKSAKTADSGEEASADASEKKAPVPDPFPKERPVMAMEAKESPVLLMEVEDEARDGASSGDAGNGGNKKNSGAKWKPYFWVACALLVCLIGYNCWLFFAHDKEEENNPITQSQTQDPNSPNGEVTEEQKNMLNAITNENTGTNGAQQPGSSGKTGNPTNPGAGVQEVVETMEEKKSQPETQTPPPAPQLKITNDLDGVISILNDIGNPPAMNGKSVEQRQQEIGVNIEKAIKILANVRRDTDNPSLKRQIEAIERSLKDNKKRLSSIEENLKPKTEAVRDAEFLIGKIKEIKKSKEK